MTLTALVSYSSSSLGVKAEWNIDTHFRWNSIRRFISIASTMSSIVLNFDLFSNITSHVRLLHFIVLESTVGISYLFMDTFIKLYTKRYDCNRYLNPLLRGISYGHFVQTCYLSLMHGTYIADTMRYLAGVFRDVPAWATCSNEVNITCISMKDVVIQCSRNRTTIFQHTSVFYYYKNYLVYSGDRNIISSRLFMTAITWIIVFLLASVSDETIVKIFNLTKIFTISTTIITILFLLYSKNSETAAALSDILNGSPEDSWVLAMQHVAYCYGIGFLGLHDYGTISPYIMVDTSSILFMIEFTILALMRSWIIKTLYLEMVKCVIIDETFVITTHSLLYAVLPSTAEFFYVKKLFLLFILGNLAVTLIALEIFLISSISKFLQYEFQKVKQIYIVGMVCAAGFGITIALISISLLCDRRPLLVLFVEGTVGLDILVLYLSAFRVAIVMWVYGVKMFATDIHFWLGFYPAKFWNYTWGLLPLILMAFLINKMSSIMLPPPIRIKDIIYMIVTFLIVTVFQIRTVAKHLIRNNIVEIFRSNKFYGPPDADDRKRRQVYNARQRKCIHNCITIDEWFTCDHNLPTLREKTSMSEDGKTISLKNIFHSENISKDKLIS